MPDHLKSTDARPPALGEDAEPVPAVFTPRGGGQLVRLLVGTNLIGRVENARIRIDKAGVSRRHAKLVVDPDGRAELFDLGSKNGTYVDGRRIEGSLVLEDGARIRLGREVELRFGWWDARLLGDAETRGPALTRRESQIVKLLAKGLGNAEIAQQLGISPRTVTTHLTRVYDRLRIKSRTALARYVIENGMGE